MIMAGTPPRENLPGYKKKDLDIWGGLNEAILQPIASDMGDAYWMQRVARERYPVADAAMNFLPTPLGAATGLAANADDLYHDYQKGDILGGAGDTIGLGVGAGRAAQYAGFIKNVVKDAPPALKGRSAVVLLAGPLAYAHEVNLKQGKATEKYKGKRLLDISKYLREAN